MLPAKGKWIIPEIDSNLLNQLTLETQLDPFLIKVLMNRNLKSKQTIEQFLATDITHMHDPFLLHDMQVAVNRIRQAIDRHEKIRIYGDYDADGVCSTVLLIHLFRQLDVEFDYYIPHRTREGYGLNREAIQLAKQSGITLMITVDNGVSAVQEVAYIRELGMDIIVTDHHEPPAILPDATAILNPKKHTCTYPFKQLAGVGVAYKLAHALLGYAPVDVLEFVTIGTVADLMPLQDENRLFVQLGLARMRATANFGIQQLFKIAGIEPLKISAGLVGFAIAPRINASGRLEHADEAVKLLITQDQLEAQHIAFELDELNKERQQLVEDITAQALAQAELQMSNIDQRVIVVSHESWNVGVVGIVASKLVERYYRPAFVMAIDKATGLAKGSARSIQGFDLYQALTQCKPLLSHFGGHHMAAGLTLPLEHMSDFTKQINAFAYTTLDEDHLRPQFVTDFSCHLDDISIDRIEKLNELGPFGIGNPAPKVVIRNMKVEQIQTIGKSKLHLKLTCSQVNHGRKSTIELLAFQKSFLALYVSTNDSLHAVAELSINEWNGNKQPQLILHDASIEHHQVFDWRTIRELDQAIRQLLERQPLFSNNQSQPPAVLCTSEHVEIQAPSEFIRSSCAIWLLDSAGQPIPYNELAHVHQLQSMTDIVWYHLPHAKHEMQRVSQLCKHMQRSYLIFKQHPDDFASISHPITKNTFIHLYKWIVQQVNTSQMPKDHLQEYSMNNKIPLPMLFRMIEVFEQLSFIQFVDDKCIIVSHSEKRELDTSSKYRDIMEQQSSRQQLFHASREEIVNWISEVSFNLQTT